jgi:hypothetical protein
MLTFKCKFDDEELAKTIEKVKKANLELMATEPRWIPVTERLPDISKSVLICDIDGDIYLGYRTRYGDYYPAYGDDRIKCVTAWMPLPEPYKEGQDETD